MRAVNPATPKCSRYVFCSTKAVASALNQSNNGVDIEVLPRRAPGSFGHGLVHSAAIEPRKEKRVSFLNSSFDGGFLVLRSTRSTT